MGDYEKHLTELDKKLDALSEQDKDFLTWQLAKRLHKKYKKELKEIADNKVAERYMLTDCIKALQRIEELLYFDLF